MTSNTDPQFLSSLVEAFVHQRFWEWLLFGSFVDVKGFAEPVLVKCPLVLSEGGNFVSSRHCVHNEAQKMSRLHRSGFRKGFYR
jgi:hypothetical protein